MAKKIIFSVSTGYAGSAIDETFTFEELGINERLNDEDLNREISEAFEDWIWGNLDASWSIDD